MSSTLALYGAPRILADLADEGFDRVEEARVNDQTYVIIRGYDVALGRFAGRTIDLALLITADYPRTVSAAIHVLATPQLFEKGDNVPNERNIADSPLGAAWCYWSKNFGWTEERSTRRLLSQINQVFLNA